MNEGNVKSVSNNAAGIVGYVSGQVTIDSCYNRAECTSGSYRAGGITAYLSSSYAKMRQTYQKTSFSPKQFEVKKSQGLAYGVGDTVRHIKFGTGTVQAIVDGGKDYEVTVDFDKAGTRNGDPFISIGRYIDICFFRDHT